MGSGHLVRQVVCLPHKTEPLLGLLPRRGPEQVAQSLTLVLVWHSDVLQWIFVSIRSPIGHSWRRGDGQGFSATYACGPLVCLFLHKGGCDTCLFDYLTACGNDESTQSLR